MMTETFFSLLLLTLLLSASAKADPAEDLTVKVVSRVNGLSQNDFRGSGVLVRYRKKVYVLTSEHVVLHAREKIGVTVGNDRIGIQKAELVAADYLHGLAVLSVPENPSFAFVSETTPVSAAAQQRVTVSGYPHENGKPTFSGNAAVLALESERGLIPGLSTLMELQNAFAEFGMSGGGVFGAGGEWLGLLSHQFIRVVPGGKSEVVTWKRGDRGFENQIFAIRATDAFAWLRKMVDAPSPCVAGIRDYRAQLAGDVTIRFPHVSVSGLAEGLDLIGGGDGAGIGGADGHGIGGNSGTKDVSSLLKIESTRTQPAMKLCPESPGAEFFPSSMIFSKMATNAKGVGGFRVNSVRSVAEAISWRFRSRAIPVPEVPASVASSAPEGNSALEAKLESAARLAHGRSPEELSSLLVELTGVFTIARSRAGAAWLKAHTIRTLLDERVAGWDRFFVADFDLATEVYAACTKLAALP